jgi:hypothetical protein
MGAVLVVAPQCREVKLRWEPAAALQFLDALPYGRTGSEPISPSSRRECTVISWRSPPMVRQNHVRSRRRDVRQLVLRRGRQKARRPVALTLALLEPGRAGSASVAGSCRILIGGRWRSRVVVPLQASVCGGGQDD